MRCKAAKTSVRVGVPSQLPLPSGLDKASIGVETTFLRACFLLDD